MVNVRATITTLFYDSINTMSSKHLQKRKKKPAHDLSYRKSERNFSRAAKKSLDSRKYQTVDKPKDLLQHFKDGNLRPLDLRPELSNEKIRISRKPFVEVEKHGPKGNPDERAMKHHTKRFYDLMYQKYHYKYHPFDTAFYENLARNRKYTLKFGYLIKPKKYFVWRNFDHLALQIYLRLTESPSSSQGSDKVYGLAQCGVDGTGLGEGF